MQSRKLSFFYMHLSIFLWGFTGIFGKIIELNTVMLVWYRLFITVVILAVLSLFLKNIKKIGRQDLKRFLFIGFCVMVHWLLFYGAIRLSNASVGISCISTVAVFTAFMEPILTGKKFNYLNLVLALCAVAGVYMIYSFHEFYRTGILLGLAAAFVGSYFTIVNAKLIKEHTSETISFYELASALFFLTIFYPVFHYTLGADIQVPDMKNSLYLLLFSVGCTVIPFSLSIKALKHVSPFTANLSINLETVYGVFLAIILLQENEHLHWGFYAGTGLILASVVLYSFIIGRKYINRNTEKTVSEMP